ncbi:N-formimino-L-glutamate deiminase [Thalassobacter stenotrophicus]|jgi:formiminoglutamate deiminase|uniref:Formiminoglutamate deiminase n=2 Tax=Rhodobacterales TaxID=204455 RepID=A0A7W9EZC7_9RHOB|nr:MULTISPECIES: formimidoylglutamate deiminase [Rhodobacterales]KGK78496.1 N-formimino-L-glutamate deiminase [Thalassobacter stenotrophicus]KGL00389.1 N-formimino-L-glutamate deiminase [Thalassobacter sp. 16PALIMAR09]MBB5723594.1 formiminoglutamate deiminase [Yoonia ponticola]WIF32439.1 putative formiminoglutamate deiminase [Lentibacter algarum]SDY88047.1 formiminoglutamate deiminase [Lentibacter algarum]|tara:strand:- start:26229 stop:27587 length:1359 start_codon:yes stop_codon:yes gene_type:complete
MIFAKQAKLSTGWASNVRVTHADGRITDIAPNQTPDAHDTCVDTLLPALANLHSHSFQRAMAGMTEYRMAGKDSFWTWRDLMYRFTANLTPEHIEAIAAFVFLEMQEAGYASVGEFHYLHHQAGGATYDDLGELSSRIATAAAKTGIGLTHLPVLYTYGGAGQMPLEAGQARFGNSVDRFNDLVARARDVVAHLPADCQVGIAPHSLRATSPDDLKAVLAAHTAGPVHIHIAEQPKEVADISAWLGARPVEWLLANADVTTNWCLIHATHMTADETTKMAKSGAVAGLCPVTEANLGDGPFNGPGYLEAGGAFGVGSDSNVLVSLTEELRTLEYSQRLRDVARNVMVVGEGSVGDTIYTGAAKGGAQALGRGAGEIAVGELADVVAIDSAAPSMCALRQDQILDGLVFAAKDDVVTDVWSAGRHAVQSGRHVKRDDIVAAYKLAMQSLMASL